MRLAALVITAVLLVGCAMTYEKPVTQSATVSAPTKADKAQVIAAARKVFVREGFQILSADESSGTLSTATRNFRLSPEQADCGTTMGIDYLKDKRTTSRLAFGVVAEDGRLTVSTTIDGEYKPGAVDQNITLTCVSRGVVERDMLAKIVVALPN
jgi:hypothetical protein